MPSLLLFLGGVRDERGAIVEWMYEKEEAYG